MTERNKIISRFENLIANNKDFYERHPDLLKKVENKIQLLKKGYDYKIINAGWIIPYIWGSSVGLQKIDKDGKIRLSDVKPENQMTIDLAKEVCQDTHDNFDSLLPTEELKKSVNERIKILNMK